VPDSNVVFTSYRDDFYGGDTNNDGIASQPNQSDWGYITIDGTAIDPQVRFRNTVFRYGGSGTTLGALRCVNSAPTADSCLFMNNAVGVSVEGASNPTLRGCTFAGNQFYAVNNTGNSFCVNAEGSWWGSASGPNDASAVADLCTLGANPGTGDVVSNNVDYQPFATSGIVSPLIGDVSLNGFVRAFDASLILQYAVSSITLSDLQKLVADVSGVGGVTALDASLILQYVAGVIPSFPAVNNSLAPGRGNSALKQVLDSSAGRFDLALGDPRRTADGWEVPVEVHGTGSVYSLELRLEGAAGLTDAAFASGSGLVERSVVGDEARVAFAGGGALPQGEVAVLRFADSGGEFAAPQVAWARVNETEVQGPARGPQPEAVPGVSFLTSPAPNPARGPMRIQLGIAASEAGRGVVITVHDLAGRTVRTLANTTFAAGVHSVQWDLRDDSGRGVPAGLYFVRARAGRLDFTRRLTVVR
jgi:parallel beta-helix repeat protein